MKSKGFTLIELLIVVAIIAILAAIAVPNFLEAQTRAKTTRTVSDLRTLAVGLESYAVDNSKYPVDGHTNTNAQADGFPYWYVPGGKSSITAHQTSGVTSPVAYLSNALLIDPFRTVVAAEAAKAGDNATDPTNSAYSVEYWKQYRYKNFPYSYGPGHANNMVIGGSLMDVYGTWNLLGNGPDKALNTDTINWQGNQFGSGIGLTIIYDATNGTISRGDIVRSQKHSIQPGPYGVTPI